MIDIHSHPLYGVDDGPKAMRESIQMLRLAKWQGITAIIATPHYRKGMFSYPNEEVERHYRKLKEIGKDMGVAVYLGTEYHVDNSVIENLRSGRCKTLAGSDYVLAEYRRSTEYFYIRESVQRLILNGYIPIIAHCERYQALRGGMDHIQNLKEMGAMIQVNADAVLGNRGFRTKWYVRKLLKEELVDFVASDSHGAKQRVNNLGKCRDYLYKKYNRNYVDKILERNAEAILRRAKS